MIENLLYERLPALIFQSRDEFIRSLDGWDIERVEIDGELAFAVLSKGPEFHFQSFGTGHPITPAMIRTCLQKIIDEHGFAQTRTPKDDTRQHRFNLRFGFRVVGEDEYDTIFRIERLPHA